MNPKIYGLDFGTSNSSIAVFDGDKARVIPVDSSSLQFQSVLFFPQLFIKDIDKFFIGNDAISNYIASHMKGRLLQSIKSFLPDKGFKSTNIYGTFYELDDLIALILAKLKRIADQYVGKEINSVILGRPAMFSENKDEEKLAEKRLVSAAEKAGFNDIYLQLEPISAALKYEDTLKKTELTLTADFGGGTSDFTIMKLSPDYIHKNDRSSDILGSKGVYIGGDRLNSNFMRKRLIKYFGADVKYETYPGKWLDFPKHYSHEICEWHKIPFLKTRSHRDFLRRVLHSCDDKSAIERLIDLIEEDLGFSLFQSIEKTKCNLSKKNSDELVFNASKIHLAERISREEFENIIRDDVNLINNCIDELLDEVGLIPSNIDSVFMTGGSSYVPFLKALLSNKFGMEKLRSADRFSSVVTGLALSARYRILKWD